MPSNGPARSSESSKENLSMGSLITPEENLGEICSLDGENSDNACSATCPFLSAPGVNLFRMTNHLICSCKEKVRFTSLNCQESLFFLPHLLNRIHCLLELTKPVHTSSFPGFDAGFHRFAATSHSDWWAHSRSDKINGGPIRFFPQIHSAPSPNPSGGGGGSAAATVRHCDGGGDGGAAMSESSSSRAARSSLEARAKEASGLPLIQCPICKKEQVLELVSKSEKNYMERFFKCPKKFIQSPLCSYYVWGDDYARYLEKKGFIGSEELRHYLQKQQMVRLEVEAERLKQEVESMREETGDTDQVKEELQVLRMEFVSHRKAVEGNMQILNRKGTIVVVLCAVTASIVLMHLLLRAVN